ncbi:MAG: transglycosylase SLT domain-containing protein [Alphaproteobacteria bacterium]|nr:transglycosylase SLT domain-containing protein [Alphaproteobacteria bacterium]
MSGNAMTIFTATFRAPARSARRITAALALAVSLLAGPATAPAGLLADDDVRAYAHAFAAVAQGNWKRARGIAARAKDRLPAKVITWMELTVRRNTASFDEITRFIERNPDWPSQRTLRLRAEEAITAATPASTLVAWFASHPPTTTEARVALGEALLALGRKEEAQDTLRRAWIEGNFGRPQESAFLRRHGKILTKADHMARLDDLLWRGNSHQAERMLGRVDAAYRPVAVARMRLRAVSGGVDSAVRRVPETLQWSDAGFMYERARWRRIKGRDDEALEILRRAPKDLVNPERWWTERAVIARTLVRNGYMSDAYRVASEHGLSPDSAQRHAEAEFLAGWIALRFLNDRKVAARHFETLYDAVRYPISRARAAYWAGRAYDAREEGEKAAEWYERAAAHDTTYYGQLAAVRLGESFVPTPPAADPRPSDSHIAAFNRDELVQVVYRLHELGQAALLRPFLAHIARKEGTPERRALAGRLALEVDRTDIGVVIAREGYRAGVQLVELGYPLISLPDGEPERALLLSVARQESNFESDAESPAGARGLMQLMPATARAMARETRTRFSSSKLTSDPAYNMELGRAYLARLIARYNGSYVLAIAAYNAGPSAVARWMRTNGDPRTEDVDLIDWIEMIPYGETRNYVQRVLENLQVYRQRLGLPRFALLEREKAATRGR